MVLMICVTPDRFDSWLVCDSYSKEFLCEVRNHEYNKASQREELAAETWQLQYLQR